MGFTQVYVAAMQDPSAAGWDQKLKEWTSDPARSTGVNIVKGTADRGQRIVGTIVYTPVVAKVEPGVVTLEVCADSSATDFLDAQGQSVKAPDQSGSYWRHVMTVDVAKYDSVDPAHAWLVTSISSDPTKRC